jgi:hypothetical protein
MNNSHDEIRQLLNASRRLLGDNNVTEQGIDLTDNPVTSKVNVTKSVEDKIDYDTADTEEELESADDKMQAYRISGGILVLHGKEQTDLELTTDEKTAFQETMDEFVTNVSDMVDFNKLNVYSNNVEWSGKLIEFDIEFFFSIGEENGVYFNGEMLKADDEFLELITKLKNYYEKFKSKWASILISRKKTIKTEE